MIRSAAWSLAVAFTAAGASAATLTVDSTVEATGNTRTYQDTDTYIRGWYVPASARNIFTGLEKFDPSLGTLTGVALSIDFDYSYDIAVQAGNVTDPAFNHSVSAAHEDRIVFRVLYRPDSSTSVVLAVEGPALDTYIAAGDAGAPPASNLTQGSGTLTRALLDITELVDLADFIGTGDVEALQIAPHLPWSLELTLDNLDAASAQINALQSPGTVSLQYTYIPVPEPASLALIALGSLLLCKRRSV